MNSINELYNGFVFANYDEIKTFKQFHNNENLFCLILDDCTIFKLHKKDWIIEPTPKSFYFNDVTNNIIYSIHNKKYKKNKKNYNKHRDINLINSSNNINNCGNSCDSNMCNNSCDSSYDNNLCSDVCNSCDNQCDNSCNNYCKKKN